MAKPPVIVLNNEARSIQIQIAHNAAHGLLLLAPGANQIDGERWSEALKLRQVQVWLKTITDNDECRGKTMLEQSAGLPALDANGADKLLREVFDRKLLATWLADEKRPDVRMVIQRRVEEMDKIEAQAEEQRKREESGEGDDAPGADPTAPPRAPRGRKSADG